ncbi:MASP1 protease, partial [Polypterus senegalus]
MYGSIQSPNFPDSYPRDSDISWNISVPDGFKIKLYFMHFDLEPSYLCEYDYVKVKLLDMIKDGNILQKPPHAYEKTAPATAYQDVLQPRTQTPTAYF